MHSAPALLDQYPRIILFDGVCNFCNSSINRVLNNDPRGYFHFATLQSQAGQTILEHFHLPTADFDSFILVENCNVYEKSSAALRVVRKMRWPWKFILATMIFPRPLRDFVYSVIARNRYKWFGQRDACILPSQAQRQRFLL
jgi:predicted DCC family thiol-disulfide oxidoreductase YuxK